MEKFYFKNVVCIFREERRRPEKHLGQSLWGVRDARVGAKEKNWPRRDSNACLQKRDRNSWISSSIFKSLQREEQEKEKKNDLKLMT